MPLANSSPVTSKFTPPLPPSDLEHLLEQTESLGKDAARRLRSPIARHEQLVSGEQGARRPGGGIGPMVGTPQAVPFGELIELQSGCQLLARMD
jgi:hypothetical protein